MCFPVAVYWASFGLALSTVFVNTMALTWGFDPASLHAVKSMLMPQTNEEMTISSGCLASLDPPAIPSSFRKSSVEVMAAGADSGGGHGTARADVSLAGAAGPAFGVSMIISAETAAATTPVV